MCGCVCVCVHRCLFAWLVRVQGCSGQGGGQPGCTAVAATPTAEACCSLVAVQLVGRPASRCSWTGSVTDCAPKLSLCPSTCVKLSVVPRSKSRELILKFSLIQFRTGALVIHTSTHTQTYVPPPAAVSCLLLLPWRRPCRCHLLLLLLAWEDQPPVHLCVNGGRGSAHSSSTNKDQHNMPGCRKMIKQPNQSFTPC